MKHAFPAHRIWQIALILLLIIGQAASAELDQTLFNDAVRYASSVAYDRGANYYDAGEIGHDAVTKTWERHKDAIFANGLDSRLRAYLAAVVRNQVIDLYRHANTDAERVQAYKDVHRLSPDRWQNGHASIVGGQVNDVSTALEYLEWIESLEPVDQKLWVRQTEGDSVRSIASEANRTYHEVRRQSSTMKSDFTRHFGANTAPDIETMSTVHEEKGLASRTWDYATDNAWSIVGWGVGGFIIVFFALGTVAAIIDERKTTSEKNNKNESRSQGQSEPVCKPVNKEKSEPENVFVKMHREEEERRWRAAQQSSFNDQPPKAHTA